MRYSLLGPLTVVERGHPVDVGPGRRRAVLVFLLLHRNEVVHAERLVDQIWGPEPPPTAGKAVQVCVSQLRRAFREAGANPGLIHTVAGGYALEVRDDELDLVEVGRALPAVRRAAAKGDYATAAARAHVALAMWHGPPLADVAFEDFAQAEILRLKEQRLALVQARASAVIALGDHEEAISELEAALQEHPLHEGMRGQLMLALYRAGRQAEALEEYRRLHRRLDDDLGVEPSEALRSLHLRMLRQDRALGGAPVPALAAVRARPPVVASTPVAAAPPAPVARLRAGRLLTIAGTLLAGAGILAILQRGASDRGPAPAVAATRGAVVELTPDGARATVIVPLAGDVQDAATAGGRLWAVTRGPPRLVEIDVRRRTVSRVLPLRGRPGAAAAAGAAVWLADPDAGTITRITDAARGAPVVRYRPSRPAGPPALASGAGTVWLADGGTRVVRGTAAGGRGAVVRTGVPVDGVAVAGGSLWAVSGAAAAVLRIDPRSGRVRRWTRIAGEPGAAASPPAHVAAGPAGLWVVSSRPPVLTRLSPRTGRAVATVRLGGPQPGDLAVGPHAVWTTTRDGMLTVYDTRARRAASRDLGRPVQGVVRVGGRPWLTLG